MVAGIRVRMHGREQYFPPGDVRIGREPHVNDLLSNNDAVSRRHALLYVDRDTWHLEDIGSKHGVYVNGTKVPRVVVDRTVTLWLGPPGRGQLLQLVPEDARTAGPFTVFLSYRRGDGAGYAVLLSERLRDHFGTPSVFHDVTTLRPGTNFVDRIERSIGSCAAVVVLIGREWTGPLPGGGRRIDDPGDVLRQEIVAALELGVRVIPVLVQDATIPPASSLPEPLRPLTSRQALRIDDTNVEPSVNELIEALEQARDHLVGAGDHTGRDESTMNRAQTRGKGRPDQLSPDERGQADSTAPLHDKRQQTSPDARVPAAWWLLPVFLNVIGGIIAYAAVRDRDPRTARHMLILGLAVFVVLVATGYS
jgi:hypothetical protein